MDIPFKLSAVNAHTIGMEILGRVILQRNIGSGAESFEQFVSRLRRDEVVATDWFKSQ